MTWAKGIVFDYLFSEHELYRGIEKYDEAGEKYEDGILACFQCQNCDIGTNRSMPTEKDVKDCRFLKPFNDIFPMNETKVEYFAAWRTLNVTPRYQFRVENPKVLLYLAFLARRLQVNMIETEYYSTIYCRVFAKRPQNGINPRISPHCHLNITSF